MNVDSPWIAVHARTADHVTTTDPVKDPFFHHSQFLLGKFPRAYLVLKGVRMPLQLQPSGLF